MKKMIAVITIVLVSTVLYQPASSAPSRAGLIATIAECKTCGVHYLQDLRTITSNRPLALKVFSTRKSVYFPGAASKKQIARLADTFYQSLKVWYRFLTDHTYQPDAKFLRRVLSTRHLEGGARADAAMMLYCTTRRIHYGILALRLQPLQATVFEHAADPQFSILLARLLAETLTGKNANMVVGGPNLASPTGAVRAEYASLAGAAFFQKVPAGLVNLLFSRYKSLQLAADAKVSRWEVRALLVYPFIARRVIGHLQPFGPKAQQQFIRSLAQQDCMSSLRNIVKAYPNLAPTVHQAVVREADRLLKKAEKLKSQVYSFR